MVRDATHCGAGFAPCLPEWIEWHRMFGFDHFIFYDNGGAKRGGRMRVALETLLCVYINRGIATVISWPYNMQSGRPHNPNEQVVASALNHALAAFGPWVRWLALFDPDEFWLPAMPCLFDPLSPVSAKASTVLREAVWSTEPILAATNWSAPFRVVQFTTRMGQQPDTCLASDNQVAKGGDGQLRLDKCVLYGRWHFGNPKLMVHAPPEELPQPLRSVHSHKGKLHGRGNLLHFPLATGRYACLPTTTRCSRDTSMRGLASIVARRIERANRSDDFPA